MKLVFCGTPDFAVPTLRALVESEHQVALVVTQPDRPVGRKKELHAPAIKQLAVAAGIPVTQPEKIKNNQELREMLQAIQPDAIVVVAYGRIIPQWMLDLPRFGNINLHGSLLPKYRGAAPVQWAVANGEVETGVSTMRLDAGLDTGDVLLEHRIPVLADALASELFVQLAGVGAELMLETLRGLEQGIVQAHPQDHSRSTLAPILTREDGRLDLTTRTAKQAYDRWRGFYPWPGAHGVLRDKRFLIHRMHLDDGGERLQPGELAVSGEHLRVGAADRGALVLDSVQIEGKPRMSGAEFARGFQLRAGERLV